MQKYSKIHVIDLSSVSAAILNPLGWKLRQHIVNQIRIALQNNDITSIIIVGNSAAATAGQFHHFSAGADLTEFASFGSTKANDTGDVKLTDVVTLIESCKKPVIAAIDGTCLGGGMEIALACHYRVATGHATMGLPEVHVGVIPGAGGTQRLPRLVGVQHAIQMICTGIPAKGAAKLEKLRLVDAIVDSNPKHAKQSLMDLATRWAKWGEVIDPTLESRRLSNRSIAESPALCHGIIHTTMLALPNKGRGGDGMRNALEAIRAATLNNVNHAKGQQIESELFIQTLISEQGMARRYGFFATRNAQRMIPIMKIDLNGVKSHPLLQKDVSSVEVGVIGAGTMGAGIAMVLLQTGYTVWLVDINPTALQNGIKTMNNIISASVQRKKMTTKQAEVLLSTRLKSTTNLHQLSNCKLIVEAVIENMSVKHKVFAALNDITSAECVLLSNTSTLDISTMASVLGTKRQRNFAGWHFFSPAHVMKLVEIVVDANTSKTAIALLQLLTKKINKIGVVVGNCDGFCGNRMLKPYSAETVMLLTGENGTKATIESIDTALNDYFGFALGPFQMGDLAGNDIGYNIRVARGWVRKDKTSSTIPLHRPSRYTELGDDMVSELGRLGQKAGKGWYNYNPAVGKGRKGIHSKEMDAFIQKYQQTTSTTRMLSNDEIIERVLYPLVNEGFKILEENIAYSPGDIDVVWLYGYGWPSWKGGPMYWADNIVGLSTLFNKLQQFYSEFSSTEHYKPSKLLKQCVLLNITVAEYYEKGLHKQITKSKL